jgi:hypothetical protein
MLVNSSSSAQLGACHYLQCLVLFEVMIVLLAFSDKASLFGYGS